ncbi:MAG: 5-deoxy-glucuronate isomerase [Actinomycetota bacterium]
MTNVLVTATDGPGVQIDVTPDSAGWRYLSFAVVNLTAGAGHTDRRPGQETAIVPLRGSGSVTAGDHTFEIGRSTVFAEPPHIVYVHPDEPISVTAADGGFEFAIGSAPAEGIYPTRLITPEEMKTEVRGGGAAHRQVNHVLAPPVAAERLILFEVYVPRGTWSGWAPHRHDGEDGSPYLEETYYFRLDPGNGFALHRNWSPQDDYDETVLVHDGDTALVPKGYHATVACPGSNMFFLNYLAGELYDGERATPPGFDEDYTWIHDDWDNGDLGAWTQPVMETPNLHNPGGMPNPS